MKIKIKLLKIMSKIENFLGNWPFFLFIFAILLGIAASILNDKIMKMNEFTKDDIIYMISEVEREYGNGEKFILLDIDINIIEKNVGYDYDLHYAEKEYIGLNCALMGYFENHEDKRILCEFL